MLKYLGTAWANPVFFVSVFPGSGLTHFINGREDSQSVGQPAIVAVPHKDDFNDLRISKPNSNNNMEEMLPMKFDQLVTWGRILQSHEITQAFNEGRF